MKRPLVLSRALGALLFISQTCFAGEGGVSGGGGNLLPDEQSTPDEVRYSIQTLSTELPYVFNAWEFLKGTGDSTGTFIFQGITYRAEDVTAVRRLLVEGTKTVFDILPGLKMVAREKGPCLDRDGKPADASAFDGAPDEICFSIERMAPKLRKGQTHLPILALGAHEVAHKLGADEPQAVAAQGFVLGRVSDRSIDFARQWTDFLRQAFDSQIHMLQSLVVRVDVAATTEANCLQLEGSMQQYDSLQRTAYQFYNFEATPLRKFQLDRIFALTFRSIYTFEYCTPETDPSKKDYRARFAGLDQVNLRDFTLSDANWIFGFTEAFGTLFGGRANGKLSYEPGEGTVRYLGFGETAKLKSELTDISNAYQGLKDAFAEQGQQ